MSGSVALYGGRPPGEGFLARLERWMRETPGMDPRSRSGLVLYAVLGFAIGFFIGVR